MFLGVNERPLVALTVPCRRTCARIRTGSAEVQPAGDGGQPNGDGRTYGVRWSDFARPGAARLLLGHGDAQSLVGVDEVVVVVVAEVELHPVDLAGEPAGPRGVVGRHR